MTTAAATPLVAAARLGGAPISWGVCEVPGWGVMLPAERVLAEMRDVGITAVELGAPGFLPRDPAALRAALAGYGMGFIGGFVPLVLHEPALREATLAEAAATAELFRTAGGDVFVTAVVVDAAWSPRVELDAAQWDHLVGMLDELEALCAGAGLVHALHPHVGTLVETAADVTTVLERSDVHWCLDTGHLMIGGYDPVRFADDAAGRVAHVHLKDVDGAVAAEVAAGALSIRAGVQRGLFRPLGAGDAPVAATVTRLAAAGYAGWYVIEQDVDLGAAVPEAGAGPAQDARRSIDYLRSLSGIQP